MVHLLIAMTPRKLLVTAGLLLGLCAAGCQASGGAGQAAPDPRPFDGITYYTARERTVLHTAEETRVTACMRDRGFSYHPQPLAPGSHIADANPYRLLSPAQARTDGFGLTSSRLNAGTAAFVDHNAKAATVPGWQEALLGTDSHRTNVRLPDGQEFFYNSDSCVSHARAQLYGPGYERLYNTFQVLANQVIIKVEADARFRSAQGAWRTCMRAAGQSSRALEDPPQAIDTQLGRAGSDSAKLRKVITDERRLAMVDASCQRKAGLADVVSTVQRGVEKTVLRGHTADAATLRRLRTQAVATADRRQPAPARARVG